MIPKGSVPKERSVGESICKTKSGLGAQPLKRKSDIRQVGFKSSAYMYKNGYLHAQQFSHKKMPNKWINKYEKIYLEKYIFMERNTIQPCLTSCYSETRCLRVRPAPKPEAHSLSHTTTFSHCFLYAPLCCIHSCLQKINFTISLWEHSRTGLIIRKSKPRWLPNGASCALYKRESNAKEMFWIPRMWYLISFMPGKSTFSIAHTTSCGTEPRRSLSL